jgi:hypothetical protein
MRARKPDLWNAALVGLVRDFHYLPARWVPDGEVERKVGIGLPISLRRHTLLSTRVSDGILKEGESQDG